MVLDSPVYLLIGAGGSGKTYTIQHLLERLWSEDNTEVIRDRYSTYLWSIDQYSTYLCAPTGKAAKVINDAFALANFDVYNEAKTIHRLLEFRPGAGWTYNADNKFDASLVIVDEASMVDSLLLATLIDALPEYCKVILVGDENQLPPVGAGQPFTDIITHGQPKIINRLTTNHRQAQGSLIADGCLKVLDGKMPTFGTHGQNTLGGVLHDDLFFLERDDKQDIPATVTELCREWHEQGLDFVILSPQRTGVCGVEEMNKHLQEALNPPHPGKAQIKVGWLTLRVGCKVLQTKNNYNLDVFNGFTGIVLAINDDDRNPSVLVDFDGQHVLYQEKDDIKQLALGYCMTVHKSQGSQFQYGVLICHSSHYFMQSRSVFYTGVSRFRKELTIVGDKKALKRALSNVVSGERQTYLKLNLQGEEQL